MLFILRFIKLKDAFLYGMDQETGVYEWGLVNYVRKEIMQVTGQGLIVRKDKCVFIAKQNELFSKIEGETMK